MLNQAFQRWIKGLHRALEVQTGKSPGESRLRTKLAKLLGVDSGDMKRWLDGSVTPNPNLDRFEQIMERARPGKDILAVFAEIVATDFAAPVRPPSRLMELSGRYADTLEALIRTDAGRAERVLANLEHAERTHLTELLAEINHTILVHGPQAAATTVAGILRREPPDEALTDELRKKLKSERQRIAREYRRIG